MTTKREMDKQWQTAVKAAAKARKMPNGAGWVASVDDLYFISTAVGVHNRREADGTWTAHWTTQAKPLVTDELFWKTLDHDSDIAERSLHLRVRAMGAFSLYQMQAGWSVLTIDGPGVDTRAVAEEALDLHEQRARDFREQTPDLEAFAAIVDAKRAEFAHLPHVNRTERAFLAIALGDLDLARRLAEEAIAHHEKPYVVGDQSVWELMLRDMDAATGVSADG